MSDKKPIRIAIIDDDLIYQKILEHILRQIGYSINFKAADGEQALSMMHSMSLRPDLAILDIEMPGMDGYETARQFKDFWPEIKIIGHSSRNDRETISKMIRSGADLFLPKRSTEKEFKAAILQLMGA